MKGALSIAGLAAFVLLLHCGDDGAIKIACNLAPDGKSCDCSPSREVIGFCRPDVVGVPAVCCAQDGWPASGLHCTCDEIVCVVANNACKCGRSTERNRTGDEVAACPFTSNDTTRCCVDKQGNCGCYPKTADECGDGATDVPMCDYFKAAIPCAAGQHKANDCEN